MTLSFEFEGHVGIGTTAPSNTLHVVGSLCVKSAAGNCAGAVAGKIYATTTTVQAADLAEYMSINDPSLVAGDVVVTEAAPTGAGVVFAKSQHANQANAAGVISTSPGLELGSDSASSRPIALAGRVPASVTLEGVVWGQALPATHVNYGRTNRFAGSLGLRSRHPHRDTLCNTVI
jgi:hypothetical protein